MSELVDWLRAQLDEDERVAEFFYDTGQWQYELQVGDEYNFGTVVDQGGGVIARCGVLALDDGEERAEHIARHDPARVLREVAAKRAIVDRVADDAAIAGTPRAQGVSTTEWFLVCQARDVLRLLASAYADRPGYREEWKP